jgi:serine/threonine protein kinase
MFWKQLWVLVSHMLGVGAFGMVKLARHKKTNRYSSVKIMNKAEIIEAKQTDHIIN